MKRSSSKGKPGDAVNIATRKTLRKNPAKKPKNLNHALRNGTGIPDWPGSPILTPMQAEVVVAVARGLTSKQIAAWLNEKNHIRKPVTTRMVEHLRADAKKVLHVRSSAQLVCEAIRLREIVL